MPVVGFVNDVDRIPLEFDEILIAMPSAKGEEMRRIVAACERTGKRYRTLPPMGELIDDASITAQVKLALASHRSTSALRTGTETRAETGTMLPTATASDRCRDRTDARRRAARRSACRDRCDRLPRCRAAGRPTVHVCVRAINSVWNRGKAFRISAPELKRSLA